jgi:hypothetical protein
VIVGCPVSFGDTERVECGGLAPHSTRSALTRLIIHVKITVDRRMATVRSNSGSAPDALSFPRRCWQDNQTNCGICQFADPGFQVNQKDAINMRTITLELLRHGPAHNQLLSPLTPCLALCENHRLLPGGNWEEVISHCRISP